MRRRRVVPDQPSAGQHPASSSVAYLHPVMDSRPEPEVRTGGVGVAGRASTASAGPPASSTSRTSVPAGARSPRAARSCCRRRDRHPEAADALRHRPGRAPARVRHRRASWTRRASAPTSTTTSRAGACGRRPGRWSRTPRSGGRSGCSPTPEPGLDRPDLMMHYGSVPFDMNTVRWGYPTTENGFCLTPTSPAGARAARCGCARRDFRDRPRVDPRYFTDPEGHDMAVMTAGVQAGAADRRAAGADGVGGPRARPGPGRGDRRRARRLHPQDPQHRLPPGLHGEDGPGRRPGRRGRPAAAGAGGEGLRVADASVLPFLPAINPNITA